MDAKAKEQYGRGERPAGFGSEGVVPTIEELATGRAVKELQQQLATLFNELRELREHLEALDKGKVDLAALDAHRHIAHSY